MQREIGRGEQLYARTMHSADVDAVQVSQTQRAEFAAVDFGAGDDDRPGDELAVQCVPVDVVRIPVFLYPLAEEEFQCLPSSGEVITSTRSPDSRVESEVGIETCPARQRRGDDEMWWLYAATSRMLLPTTPGLEILNSTMKIFFLCSASGCGMSEGRAKSLRTAMMPRITPTTPSG